MARHQHAGMINPMGLIWILSGWHKFPKGREVECDELMADPPGCLSKGEIEFPTVGLRMYLAWLPVFLLAEWLLKVLIHDRPRNEGAFFIFWGGAIATLALYIFGPMSVLSRRLRLDVRGFHLVQGRKSLFVPWTAIIYGRDWNIGIYQIRIPIVGHAKDLIEVTTDTTQNTISDGATPFGMKFENQAEINLTWPFVLDPRIFVQVGKQLAAVTQSTEAPPEREVAYVSAMPAAIADSQSHDELPSGVKLRSRGAIQLPVSALAYPPVCCRCGGDALSVRSIYARVRYWWWMPARAHATVDVPVCKRCWNGSQLQCLAIIVGAEVAWTLLIIYAVFGSFNQSLNAYLCTALVAIIPTRFVFFFLPPLWWRVADIVVNHSSNEVRLRFANSDYRELVLNAIQNRDADSF